MFTVSNSNGIGTGSFFLNLSFICVRARIKNIIETADITTAAGFVFFITLKISIKFLIKIFINFLFKIQR